MTIRTDLAAKATSFIYNGEDIREQMRMDLELLSLAHPSFGFQLGERSGIYAYSTLWQDIKVES